MTKEDAIRAAEEEARTVFCPVINGMCVGKKCVCFGAYGFSEETDNPSLQGHCAHGDIDRFVTGPHEYEKEQS